MELCHIYSSFIILEIWLYNHCLRVGEVLNTQIKKDCESIFYNICTEQGYKIHAMEIVEDHVHLFLEFQPKNSLSEVVQYLKGGSSYRIF